MSLVIRAHVLEGWHFYPVGEKKGANIPTKISIELPEGMSFEGDWILPDAKDGKLGQGATFERTINVGKKLHDLTHLKGRITFQACTEIKCLQEQSLEFKLPLTVIPR